MNKLYSILNHLTENKNKPKFTERYSDEVLANRFLDFFENKTQRRVYSFSKKDAILDEVSHRVLDNKLICFENADLSKVEQIVGIVRLANYDHDLANCSEGIELLCRTDGKLFNN